MFLFITGPLCGFALYYILIKTIKIIHTEKDTNIENLVIIGGLLSMYIIFCILGLITSQ